MAKPVPIKGGGAFGGLGSPAPKASADGKLPKVAFPNPLPIPKLPKLGGTKPMPQVKNSSKSATTLPKPSSFAPGRGPKL